MALPGGGAPAADQRQGVLQLQGAHGGATAAVHTLPAIIALPRPIPPASAPLIPHGCSAGRSQSLLQHWMAPNADRCVPGRVHVWGLADRTRLVLEKLRTVIKSLDNLAGAGPGGSDEARGGHQDRPGVAARPEDCSTMIESVYIPAGAGPCGPDPAGACQQDQPGARANHRAADGQAEQRVLHGDQHHPALLPRQPRPLPEAGKGVP